MQLRSLFAMHFPGAVINSTQQVVKHTQTMNQEKPKNIVDHIQCFSAVWGKIFTLLI